MHLHRGSCAFPWGRHAPAWLLGRAGARRSQDKDLAQHVLRKCTRAGALVCPERAPPDTQAHPVSTAPLVSAVARMCTPYTTNAQAAPLLAAGIFYLGPRLGRERCSKINGVTSDGESGTGIGVVVGFSGVAGHMNWPHLKRDGLVLGGLSLQML